MADVSTCPVREIEGMTTATREEYDAEHRPPAAAAEPEEEAGARCPTLAEVDAALGFSAPEAELIKSGLLLRLAWGGMAFDMGLIQQQAARWTKR